MGGVCPAAETGSQRNSRGCGSRAPLAAGESVALTLQVGELERQYRLHLPRGYNPKNPFPLVLAIHGYTGNAMKLENDYTSFSRHADANGYVVAYPQATGFDVGGMMVTSWNDLACNASSGPEGSICTEGAFDYPTPPECGEPSQCDWCSCYDDVGFIEALLDELESTLCIDLDRVYATGISNGGMFVKRLGYDLPDRFAAIAPVAGTIAKGFNCAPGSERSTPPGTARYPSTELRRRTVFSIPRQPRSWISGPRMLAKIAVSRHAPTRPRRMVSRDSGASNAATAPLVSSLLTAPGTAVTTGRGVGRPSSRAR